MVKLKARIAPKPEPKPAKEKKVVVKEKKEPVHDGKFRGKTWGLRLHDTFKRMLQENFKLKRTDDEMVKFLLKEFSEREPKNILYNMREIRWRYNCGELFKNENDERVPPQVKSVPYDKDGNERVRVVKHPKLTAEEKAVREAKRIDGELERRKEEVERLCKLEAKIVELRTSITERQSAWDAKYGPLKEEEKTEEVPPTRSKKVKVKKA